MNNKPAYAVWAARAVALVLFILLVKAVRVVWGSSFINLPVTITVALLIAAATAVMAWSKSEWVKKLFALIWGCLPLLVIYGLQFRPQSLTREILIVLLSEAVMILWASAIWRSSRK